MNTLLKIKILISLLFLYPCIGYTESKKGHIKTYPVNHKPIAIPPLQTNQVNKERDYLEQNLKSDFELRSGNIGDRFIRMEESEYYNKTLPNHRKDTIYKRDKKRLQKQKERLEDPNTIIDEYSSAKDRITVVTIKK